VWKVRLSTGTGFAYSLVVDISTMHGLPSKSAFMGVDIDADGTVSGLF
jgi:formyltetrahydrofolate synthetase